jgi:hypothetical protein
MSTRAQRRANLRNAQLSTGPRTPEGKTASARNAIKHNLSGTTFVLLPGEDRAAFDALGREYRDEWKPRTPHETFLVAQMVQARWRLNRIARMEAEMYDAIFTMPFAQDKTDEGAILMAYPLMNNPMLDRLQRYARDAERAYHRAVREFQQYRKAQPQPAALAQAAEKSQPFAVSAPVQNEAKPPHRDGIVSIYDPYDPASRGPLEDVAPAAIH